MAIRNDAFVAAASTCGLFGPAVSLTSPPPWNDATAPMRSGIAEAVWNDIGPPMQ